MANLLSQLNELYIRFLIWLGAAPPPGYEHLMPGQELGPVPYTVQAGDTLFSIARRFGVHYDLIAQANNITEPEALEVGQTITIPTAGGASVASPKSLPQPSVPEPEAEPATEELFDEPPEQWFAEPEPAVSEAAVPPAEAVTPTPTADSPEEVTSAAPEPPSDEISLPALDPAPVAEPEPVTVEPAAQPQPFDPATAFRYEVQRGDTLNSVARRYGITVKDLIDTNDIANPNLIYPGQKLIIPGYMTPPPAQAETTAPSAPPIEEETPVRAAPPSEYVIHTVTVGDTLSAIAKRYGVTVRQLVETNQIEDPTGIRPQQKLIIPGVTQPPAQPQPDPVAPSAEVEAEAAPVSTPAPPEPQPALKPAPAPPAALDSDSPAIGSRDAIRAIYVSYFALGHPDFREHMLKLLDTTEFNAVVIDVKGDHGFITYPTQHPTAQEIGAARPTARDFAEVMAHLKTRRAYTIARIVTFKDSPLAKSHPDYAVKTAGGELWHDREQLRWCDPFLKPVWDYNIQLAIEAAQKGFDEIQFDFLRFPIPSQLGPPQFSQEVSKETRVAAITGFLSAVSGQLHSVGVKVSAATFGYTCWRKDDTQIGQDIERMAEYLDVLCPMLYPSTFGSGIPGYKQAVAHPYEIV
ncbi:MAG: putative glycoside hydrolase, partial [Anaerolineae bacterium]|nr:putative glycoside hydrolase [Anaerolineae bacterium]